MIKGVEAAGCCELLAQIIVTAINSEGVSAKEIIEHALKVELLVHGCQLSILF